MIPFERQSLGYSKSRRKVITPLLYRNIASKLGRSCTIARLKYWLPFLGSKESLALTSTCSKQAIRRMKRIKLRTLLLFTIVFLIFLIVTILTFMHYYYTFEADITVIYLDDQEDVERAKNAGHFAGLPFNKWNYYEKFKQSGLSLYRETKRVRNGSISPPVFEEETGNQGYWIYKNWPTSIATQNVHSSIHLTNFQFFNPHKIAFAIRFFLGGYSRIDITFTGYRKNEMKTVVIRQIGKKHHMANSLCTQHILSPFEYIKMVSIQAYTFNSTSFVVFDKIALAVGNESRAQNMLYTLLPSQWCKNVRLETQDPLPPPAKKPS